MTVTARQEHALARVSSPHVFTLYLQPQRAPRPRSRLARCGHLGPQGSWEVFRGYQGTMPAKSWTGTVISLAFTDDDEWGMCTMTWPDEEGRPGFGMLYRFFTAAGASEHTEGHIDLYMGTDPVQPLRWIRGAADEGFAAGRMPPMALVMDSTFFFRGERPHRPAGIPEGLPSIHSFVAEYSRAVEEVYPLSADDDGSDDDRWDSDDLIYQAWEFYDSGSDDHASDA